MRDPYRGYTYDPGPSPAPVDLDALAPDCEPIECYCGWSTGLRDDCVCWWDDGDNDPECHCEECEEEPLAELRALVEPPWITLTPNARYL